MEMCYDGALVMPSNYAVMSEDEMMYVSGAWTLKPSLKKIKGIPVGVYLTFTGTISDYLWIGAAGCGVIGAALAYMGCAKGAIAAAFAAFICTFAATHDKFKNSKKLYSISKYYGL